MSSRSSPITVVTSPTGGISPARSSPQPRTAGPSTQQHTYTIQENRRTICFTSSLPPGELDTKVLNELLTLPDPEVATIESQPLRQGRSKSLNENDLAPVIATETSNQKSKETLRSSNNANRYSRNLLPSTPAKSSGYSSTPTTPVSVRSVPSPRIPGRKRILFYNRQDPHYGFTNFSAHPVVYKGKCYPTSEHLFQSFKVSRVRLSQAPELI